MLIQYDYYWIRFSQVGWFLAMWDGDQFIDATGNHYTGNGIQHKHIKKPKNTKMKIEL